MHIFHLPKFHLTIISPTKKMSTEEAKRSINGALTVKPTTNERKPSLALTAELATSPAKKVIVKSADMKDDMQKEAVNIAISVSDLSLPFKLPFLLGSVSFLWFLIRFRFWVFLIWSWFVGKYRKFVDFKWFFFFWGFH